VSACATPQTREPGKARASIEDWVDDITARTQGTQSFRKGSAHEILRDPLRRGAFAVSARATPQTREPGKARASIEDLADDITARTLGRKVFAKGQHMEYFAVPGAVAPSR